MMNGQVATNKSPSLVQTWPPRRSVDEAHAMGLVTDYAIGNEVSYRGYRLEREGKWMRRKWFPTFGPLRTWPVAA